MKKFLLSLAAVVLVGAFAMAEPVTVNFADETTAALLPKKESATPSTVKINEIDFEFMNSKKGAYSGASYLQISAKKGDALWLCGVHSSGQLHENHDNYQCKRV